MTATDITKQLISIPSYVDSGTNESAVAGYVYDYLARLKFLRVEKQQVAPGRFNVVARSAGRPRLLLAGHMDTVQPKLGWTKDQLATEGSRLYGTGAVDMKGGMASILAALRKVKDPQGLVLLFYCDEEYDFRGMRHFIDRGGSEPPADLAIVAESSDLQLWNSHRGLIELTVAVRGRTGHASRPQAGVNAIAELTSVLADMELWLREFRDPSLGTPSLNIAYFTGGLELTREPLLLGREGNNIADYAEAVLDIRTTTPKLRAEKVARWLQAEVSRRGLKMAGCDTRHDLGALSTDKADLVLVAQAVAAELGRAQYADPGDKGYGDGQLLQEAFGLPVLNLGPVGGNAHAPDEWVDTGSLEQLANIYARIIHSYCS